MRKFCLLVIFMLYAVLHIGQVEIEYIEEIHLDQIPSNKISKYWLKMIDNGLSQPVYIPLLIAKGKEDGPVLGLTAAIHGNELNGIGVIQHLFEKLDIESLSGTIIAIPGLNGISLPLHERRYIDEEDLNRNFPGKKEGNRSQQYVWQINEKILTKIDYLIDMHTASFGRENSLYVRADMEDADMAKMALLQDADIILANKGVPSASQQIVATRTMRAEAVLKGVPTITVEYANPQIYQPEIIQRGVIGVENTLSWLGMITQDQFPVPEAIRCKKSYWLFIDQGGYLEVKVGLKQVVDKDELIAVLKNPFGDVIKEYFAPERGVVIGRSSNPINMSGGRIIHLGIMDESK